MPDRSNVYTDAITNLSSHHVVVVGLARNCEGALPRTLAICEYIADVFGRAYFVFVENGSIDATRHRLNDWTVVRGDCVIIQPEVDVEQLSRTERIAACRNIAIEFSRKNYSHCSLMIAIDMDLDLSDLNRRSFLDAIHYLLSSPNVVGVFPNSFPVYYDLYALRHPVWCPNDVIIELHSEDEEYPASASFSKYIYSRQMYISLETQPIKVQSAFGGMGVYILREALKSSYRGTSENGDARCEHVSFNESLDGDLYILPFWRINAPHEHIAPDLRPKPHATPLPAPKPRLLKFFSRKSG